MSLLFSLTQWKKNNLKKILLLTLLLILSLNSRGVLMAQENKKDLKTSSSTPEPIKVVKASPDRQGPISALKELIDITKGQVEGLNKVLSKNPTQIVNLQNIESIKIDPRYMLSLFLFSDEKYMNLLSKNNTCYFYSLLHFNLLKSSTTNTKVIPVIITYQSKKKESTIVHSDDLLFHLKKKNCSTYNFYEELHDPKKISSLLKKLPIKEPQTQKECQKSFDGWQKHPSIPAMCSLVNKMNLGALYQEKLKSQKKFSLKDRRKFQTVIRQAMKVKKNIPKNSFRQMNHLCRNINQQQNYCHHYMAKNFWQKILRKEIPKYYIANTCEEIVPSTKQNDKSLRKCITKIENDPHSCQFLKTSQLKGLSPKPSCQLRSTLLNHSRLKAKYYDCPSKTMHEGITNLFRIYKHFDNKSWHSSQKEQCFTNATSYFAESSVAENKKAWNLKYCYYSNLEEKEVCLPTILGKHEKSPLSEDKVIAKIFERTKGTPPDLQCQTISEREYKPSRLSYKSGCFLIYKEDNCDSTYCPKTIKFRDKTIEKISFKGKSQVSYFPESLSREQFSISAHIKDKIKKKLVTIQNLTELKYHINHSPELIIHGKGCIEDLLPKFFKKRSLNSCRPIPFIIDGLLEKSGKTFLTIQYPIDPIHHPRMIEWGHLYSSVLTYSKIHPLRSWKLYGIK